MTQWPVPTTHSILVGGLPLFYEPEAATGSAILPGDLVQFNNPPNDCTVKEGQADSTTVFCVANIHPVGTSDPPRGGDRTTAFSAGDQIEGISGPITVMLMIAASAISSCMKNPENCWTTSARIAKTIPIHIRMALRPVIMLPHDPVMRRAGKRPSGRKMSTSAMTR